MKNIKFLHQNSLIPEKEIYQTGQKLQEEITTRI